MTPNAALEPFPPLEGAPQSQPQSQSTSGGGGAVAALKATPSLPISAAVENQLDSSRGAAAAAAAARRSPNSPSRSSNNNNNNNVPIDTLPQSKTNKLVATPPGRSPIALTGAGAMAEARKRKSQPPAQDPRQSTSSNPAAQAISSLLGVGAGGGVGGGVSRPTDAPVSEQQQSQQLSEPMQRVAEKIQIPETNTQADNTTTSSQVSPDSITSFGTGESLTGASSALTATASNGSVPGAPQFTAEPVQMGDADQENGNESLEAPSTDGGPKAYSYPGPPPRQNSESTGKRHKCPYCSTDFTRHHNLKSHLLTHSQEKPYYCQQCSMRFRRLHDLKRHTKLHTGERPHTCDKCGRRFARGDALARHNKGPGGCAGRRSSFGGEDDFGGDGNGPEGMDGVEYTGGEDDEGSSPDQGRRESEPNRKRTHLETQHDSDRQVYRQQSSTYPPVYPPPPQNRPHGSGMGPPQVVLPSSGQVSSPREMSNYPSPATASTANSSAYYNQSGAVFPQPGGMTESPKPLSPGQQAPADQHRLSVGGDASMSSTMHRNRSPSLTTQFQQAHFGRGSVGGRTPPPLSSSNNNTNNTNNSQAPVLPPLNSNRQSTSAIPGTNGATTAGPPGPSLLNNQSIPGPGPGPGLGSNPGSHSSHGAQSSTSSSVRDVFLGGSGPGSHPQPQPQSQQQHQQQQQPDSDVWAYIRDLENRFGHMRDEYELRISRLQNELISLRGQVSTSGGPGGGVATTAAAGAGGGSGGGGGTYSTEIPQPRY